MKKAILSKIKPVHSPMVTQYVNGLLWYDCLSKKNEPLDLRNHFYRKDMLRPNNK